MTVEVVITISSKGGICQGYIGAIVESESTHKLCGGCDSSILVKVYNGDVIMGIAVNGVAGISLGLKVVLPIHVNVIGIDSQANPCNA